LNNPSATGVTVYSNLHCAIAEGQRKTTIGAEKNPNADFDRTVSSFPDESPAEPGQNTT
jgi:hypothetical protein